MPDCQPAYGLFCSTLAKRPGPRNREAHCIKLWAQRLSSPEFWNPHAQKMLLFDQDRLYKDKLLTRSILIDDSIHDYWAMHVYRLASELLEITPIDPFE
jgi:hypothetical protein